jgi:hypothetical protein
MCVYVYVYKPVYMQHALSAGNLFASNVSFYKNTYIFLLSWRMWFNYP